MERAIELITKLAENLAEQKHNIEESSDGHHFAHVVSDLQKDVESLDLALEKLRTSESGLHIDIVSNSEERVAVGCHTCKHNPHAPFVPKICDECNSETLSKWEPTDC